MLLLLLLLLLLSLKVHLRGHIAGRAAERVLGGRAPIMMIITIMLYYSITYYVRLLHTIL